MFKEIFPLIETALDMEPEELAPFILKHLKKIGKINRYNYTSGTGTEIINYAGERIERFQKQLMEAFIWLEREMFVAPMPGTIGEWRFITRRGEKALEEEDFTAYVKGSLLSSETLHPTLARKVKPLFLRGDYDTAIFQAFKIVEVQVRKTGGYSKGDYGVPLMRKAFNVQTGSLTNKKAEESEKQAMSDLFAGAIGLFKNPVSHRFIDDISPEDAADLVRFANFLLKVLGD
ncbi:TIGR02391 family protein [Patescibacteria group bacterium]|nr:TIGR02391 family protein [Patescibacteria group bacterium]